MCNFAVVMIQKATDIYLADDLDEFLQGASGLHGGIMIIFCKEGSIQIAVNDSHFVMHANELFICIPSFLVGNYMRTPDFRSSVLYVSGTFLDEIAYECFRGEPMWVEKQLYIRENPVIKMNDYQLDLLTCYYRLLSAYLQGKQDGYHRQIICSLVRACTMEVLGYLEMVVDPQGSREISKNVSQKDALLFNFLKLLRESNDRIREVQYYAAELCITPKHLSAVCKERSGKTASQWIAELTIERLKHLLLTTDMPVKEVAFRSGFKDVSFFCQYVRKHLGVSPQEFRKKNKI